MTIRHRVAVIMLTSGDYAERYLQPCYESLMRQTYPQKDFQICLVRNGPTNTDRLRMTQMAPAARVLENAENLGWAGGNNRAIRQLLNEGVEYLVMLNIDTVVDPNWLCALVEAADASEELHILQSKILLNGTNQINSLGNRIQYLGYGYCVGYGQPDQKVAPKGPIDFASGASMLVKREVFEMIGDFRAEYFMYYDDLEFCWRARISGFHIGLVEGSVCHHNYTFESRSEMLYYQQRNRLLTILSLERLGTIAVIAPCLLVSEVILGIYFTLHGRGGTMWRLLRYFLRWRTWRAIADRRRTIQRLRTRKDAEIVRQFAGTFAFIAIDSPLMRYVVNPLLGIYWAVARRLIVW